MEVKDLKNTNEKPLAIVIGILGFYVLVAGFIFYLFVLHRISFVCSFIIFVIFSIIYFPRLLIIRKLKNKDDIKILDNAISINGKITYFSEILDYRITKKKPQVIFFFAGQMTIFQEAEFHLKTNFGQVSFIAIGSEKIDLLKSFFDELLDKSI